MPNSFSQLTKLDLIWKSIPKQKIQDLEAMKNNENQGVYRETNNLKKNVDILSMVRQQQRKTHIYWAFK